MAKERMVAEAEEIHGADSFDSEAMTIFQQRVAIAVQECLREGITLAELVAVVRKRMRDKAH
jgi:hypothetical protein